MVKQLAAEVVFARRGGKLTPRHAMHLAKLKTRAEDTGGRATARSLCSGGFLPPPPAHLGRAGVATLAEACPPCAGLAAFGAACCTARVSRVLRIVARRCVVAPRDRDLNATRSRRRWLAQAGGRFAAASRRPKTAAIARWSRRYGSEEKRAGRAAADLLWLYLAAASPAHRGDHARD
jgi:hypothetical protein